MAEMTEMAEIAVAALMSPKYSAPDDSFTHEFIKDSRLLPDIMLRIVCSRKYRTYIEPTEIVDQKWVDSHTLYTTIKKYRIDVNFNFVIKVYEVPDQRTNYLTTFSNNYQIEIFKNILKIYWNDILPREWLERLESMSVSPEISHLYADELWIAFYIALGKHIPYGLVYRSEQYYVYQNNQYLCSFGGSLRNMIRNIVDTEQSNQSAHTEQSEKSEKSEKSTQTDTAFLEALDALEALEAPDLEQRIINVYSSVVKVICAPFLRLIRLLAGL